MKLQLKHYWRSKNTPGTQNEKKPDHKVRVRTGNPEPSWCQESENWEWIKVRTVNIYLKKNFCRYVYSKEKNQYYHLLNEESKMLTNNEEKAELTQLIFWFVGSTQQKALSKVCE